MLRKAQTRVTRRRSASTASSSSGSMCSSTSVQITRSAGRWIDKVRTLADRIAPDGILDYGCGKGLLAQALPWPREPVAGL
jgi:2-polyprenyl-3-methyl-5-hydroxy-6-metoxy-1,4-benzoquinol methylase